MTNKRILFVGVSLVALLILVSAVAASPVPAGNPLAKIDPELWQTIQRDGKASFIAVLAEKADTSAAAALPTKREKGEFVYQALRATADRTQAGLRSYLASKGVHFKPYYIVNAVLIEAGQDVLLDVAARPEVSQVVLNRYFKAITPEKSSKDQKSSPTTTEWNISFIHADEVWTQYSDTGVGAVVGDLDTGVDYTHPALVNQYRGNTGSGFDHNYNWWDAVNGQSTPYDDFGHGTHTTGTAVGGDGPGPFVNDIGVAPGAKWIGCKNMDSGGYGQDAWFITCFQFALAPWDLNGQNPNPALAPDVVNNSWGYWGGNYTVFHDVIQSLRDAGVFVEVSAGNEGPSCSTLRSPGDYDNVFTTGATADHSETLVDFSSRGPSIPYPTAIKPDIVAPGENIRSSLPGGTYAAWAGTSMAGPHVVGTVALIVSANPGLKGQVATIEQLIRDTAYTGMPNPPDPDSCGGVNYNVVPNYIYGWGRVDALAAVSQIAHVGYLEGHVTDQTTGNPIPGAIVSTNMGQSTTTDATGYYTMTLSAGTYDVTATKYLWTSQTVTGVVIVEGATTTQDFQLSPVQNGVVSGTVTDGSGHGWPLYARIDISAPGFNTTIFTDPATGTYSVTLAEGTVHTFVVSAVSGGYNTETRSVTPPATENFALTVDGTVCTAPGYTFQYAYFQDFEADNGGFTASGSNSTWAWGVPTSGPGSAHSGSNVWATNLSGNYNDYEDSYITSPDIDLSGRAGQEIILSWWQWLQTESCCDYGNVDVSNNGGATWTTVYGPAYGNTDLQWAQHTVTLDPSYAVSNFRVRFHLHSDLSITYPGWYVDDISIRGTSDCAAVPGGLVEGNVYDANTGAGLNGATVTSLDHTADKATTFGTPDDPNVADGFYILFSSLTGTHPFQASSSVEGYGTDTQNVNVVTDAIAVQDFHLPAPSMSVTPASLEGTAELGLSTQVTMTIHNTGGVSLTWQIFEQQGGLAQPRQVQIPARPEAPKGTAAGKAGQTPHDAQTVTIKPPSKPHRPAQVNVLLVNADDDNNGYSPIQQMLQAYGDLGAVDLFDARYATPTLAQLQAYDVVVTWSNYVYADPVGMGNVLADYVDAGGKVINLMFSMGTHGWQMQGRFMDEGYTAMNGSYILFTTSCLGTYDPNDPIMQGVTNVCDFYRLQSTYLTAGSTAVAYWQDGEIFVAKKDNATVVSIGGYVGLYYGWTGQMADVLHNSINWVFTGSDVPWLSENPTSGTVPPASSQDVAVTMDASQLQQPGDYTAALRVSGNDPFTPRVTVPVTFHVLPNPNMGAVTGQVTTDRPGGPLEGADVCIVGGFCTQTDPSGNYTIYAVAGTHDMTASYTGYITGTATVEILAGQTITQNFELIRNAPEMSVSPSSLEATALLGESTQQTLTISNSGVADLVWQIFEQSGGQAQAHRLKTVARPQAPKAAAAGKATSQPQPGGTTASGSAAAQHVATGKGQVHRAGPHTADVLVLNTTSIGQSVARALNELGVAFDQINSSTWTGIDFSSYQTVFATMDGGLVMDTDVQAVRTGVVDAGKRLIFLGGTCWQPFALGVNTYLLANDTNNYCWTISASPQWTLVDPSHGLAQGLPSQYNWLNPSAGFYQIRPTDTEAEYVAINGDGYYNFLYKNTYGAGDFIWFTSSVYDGYWGNQGDYDILKQIISNSLTYSADVPWLSENPTSGTVPPASSQDVTVTFDAAQLQQPGDYTAALRVSGNDPFTPRVTVPVTFHVLPNPNMGAVTGQVTTDRPGGPLEGADVCIVGGFCTQTDPSGNYTIYAVAGTYSMTASYTGYITGTATVEILAGQTITQNFELILDQPNMTVTPTSLQVTVVLSTSTQTTVTIGNTGVANLTWQVSEIPSGLTRAMLRIGSAPVRRVNGQVSPLWVGRSKAGAQPAGPLPLAPNDPPWTNIANYPTSIMDSSAAEINGLIYSVGGYDGFSILSSGYVYDPASNSWSPIASMSNTREKPAVAAINGLLYVVGGWDSFGTPVAALEIYDPSTNTWSTGASIPVAHAGAPGVALNGEFYVIGGCSSFSCGYTDVYRYDPASNSWSTVAAYPEAVSWNHCGAINGMIYCAGGVTDFGSLTSTYVYDPGSNTWSPLASMPQDQWAGGYVAANGYLYVSGGVTNGYNTITNEGFAYDPGTNTWSSIENSNNTVYRGASACGFYRIGGSIGGFTPIPNSEVYPGLTNCGGITDIPWLSESPITGTVAPGGSQEVTVTFDAHQVPSTGVYSGTLRVSGNDPYNRRVDIPVTMIVIAAGYGVEVSPPTAAQTGHPGTTLTYNLDVTNVGDLPDTFNVTISGNTWTTTAPATIGPLNPGETATLTVTVDIPFDAADGATDTATVAVTSQGDPTKSASSVLTSTSVFYQIYMPWIPK